MNTDNHSIIIVEPCNPSVRERGDQVEFMQFLMNELGRYGELVDGVGVFSKQVKEPGLQFFSIASRKLTPLIFCLTLAARLLLLSVRSPKLAHVACPLYVLPFAWFFPSLPVVLSVFSDRLKRRQDYGVLGFLQTRVEQSAYKKAACITVVSREIASEIPNEFQGKVSVLDCSVANMAYFTVDASDALQRQFGFDNNYFVTATDFSDDSVGFLIEIWAQYYQQQPTMTLVIIGDGQRRGQMEEKVSARCHWNRPRFVGQLPKDTHARMLQSSVGYICMGSGEYAGQRLNEALSCALPIVVADDSQLARGIDQGEIGYIIPKKIEVYAQALDALARKMISRESIIHYRKINAKELRPGSTLISEIRSVYQSI
jgi:glycosyltransferase involved in cell wall biosynthesis